MKKNLMTLAAVLCCAMVCFFASCQKNGGSSTTPEEQPDNTPAAVEMTFTFWGTQDMLDFADMVVTYNDGTGDKTETVTTVNWVKTIKVALPVTFKFARKVTLKDGVTLNDSQAYSYVNAHQVKYSIQTANGKKIKSGTAGGSGSPNSLKGSKINAVIKEGRLDSSHTYVFDKEGKCPQLDFPE